MFFAWPASWNKLCKNMNHFLHTGEFSMSFLYLCSMLLFSLLIFLNIPVGHKSKFLIWFKQHSNNVLFLWYFNGCKMLLVRSLTNWPQSCFVEMTSHSFFFPPIFQPGCFRKICWRSAHNAEAQFSSFQQQSVVKHFKWKLICDLHGQWGENELMKCCKWNIRQGAVGECRQRW